MRRRREEDVSSKFMWGPREVSKGPREVSEGPREEGRSDQWIGYLVAKDAFLPGLSFLECM